MDDEPERYTTEAQLAHAVSIAFVAMEIEISGLFSGPTKDRLTDKLHRAQSLFADYQHAR